MGARVENNELHCPHCTTVLVKSKILPGDNHYDCPECSVGGHIVSFTPIYIKGFWDGYHQGIQQGLN